MSRAFPLCLLLLLALPPGALAQSEADAGVPSSDGGSEDGGLPDASVGEGGADRDNEQGEDRTGRVVTVCDRPSDCSPGFSCAQGRCTWIGIREAEGGFGCGGGALAALVLPFAVLVSARSRSTRRCSGSAARRTRPRRR